MDSDTEIDIHSEEINSEGIYSEGINLTLENWNGYYNNIHNQITNMWNFILYNQFNNEEINRLHKEINLLKKENNDLNDKYKSQKRKYDTIKEDYNELKDKIEKYEPSMKKRKLIVNLLKDEFSKTNIEIDNIYNNDDLKNIFSNMNNINDIINLKNINNKFNYMENSKFVKLYNLIPTLEELNNIIGMENVKETIFKSICYFIYNLHNKKELNHVMITGPPGVGKTTVAQIIGKIYLSLGFLENDTFNIAKRSDLIAGYLGQTAIKTQKMIDKSIGGVLFIDEVYSLGNNEGRDIFSKECIDTINLNMTRDEPWLLIVGGYKEDIEKSFLSYNKGLERRFTIRLNIDNYTGEQLFLIFKKFVKDDNWFLHNENDIKKLIIDNKNIFKYFGGDIQKIFQKSKEYYSLRLMKETIDLNNVSNILTFDDINNSINDMKKNINNNNDIDKYILHSMYT
jgi:SpoVK/Ycf46/Vps4 family AAA+-type ATPase